MDAQLSAKLDMNTAVYSHAEMYTPVFSNAKVLSSIVSCKGCIQAGAWLWEFCLSCACLASSRLVQFCLDELVALPHPPYCLSIAVVNVLRLPLGNRGSLCFSSAVAFLARIHHFSVLCQNPTMTSGGLQVLMNKHVFIRSGLPYPVIRSYQHPC